MSKLEALCPPPSSEHMGCMSMVHTDMGQGAHLAPGATPPGCGPADLKCAYKLPTTTYDPGHGPRGAIVDAFDDPVAEDDLAVYRAQYGLSPRMTADNCFPEIKMRGPNRELPSTDSAWIGEICLDLDMAWATCPDCSILAGRSHRQHGSGRPWPRHKAHDHPHAPVSGCPACVDRRAGHDR